MKANWPWLQSAIAYSFLWSLLQCHKLLIILTWHGTKKFAPLVVVLFPKKALLMKAVSAAIPSQWWAHSLLLHKWKMRTSFLYSALVISLFIAERMERKQCSTKKGKRHHGMHLAKHHSSPAAVCNCTKDAIGFIKKIIDIFPCCRLKFTYGKSNWKKPTIAAI